MLQQLLVLLAAMGLATSAMAQESSSGTTTTTIEEAVEDTDIVKEGDDIDEEITNARLRAESGSKSKWSGSATIGYNGGSVESPFSAIRPNYRRGTAPAPVVLGADIKGRYRLNKNQSLALGTGVSAVQPFHGGFESADKAQDNTSLSSPYLAWSSYYSVGDLQMSSGIDYTYYTAEGSTAAGYNQALTLSQSFLGTVLDNRLTMGISVSASYSDVDNSDAQLDEYNAYLTRAGIDPLTRQGFNEDQTDIGLGVYPFAEYTLSDMYALRTVFGYFNYERTLASNDLKQTPSYQSVGLAISPGRNLYVYPNIQFVPNDIRAERTNVAVSATINFL